MNFNSAACTPLNSDHILAADLAHAIPEFTAVAPDTVVGYSPLPGVRRTLRAAELRRLATKYDIQLTSDREPCFEWPLYPVSREAIIQSMRESLQATGTPIANLKIEIVELGTRVVPQGKVIFPLSGLLPSAIRTSNTAMWRGYVMYSGDRRFDLWARVNLSAPTTRVVAVTNIPAGRTIESADVRLETVDDFPIWHEVARHLDEVVGCIARRSIPSSHSVLRADVTRPLEIESGDVIEVDVQSGRAHVKLQGRAENSGRQGEIISVRNPRSGKSFRARVEAKGKAVVMPGVTGGMVN